MITPAQFKERFPQFDSIANDRIQLFLNDAETMLSVGCWGTWYDKGLALLAAHYLALSILQESASSVESAYPLSSKKVGDVQLNFAVPSSTGATEDYYKKTPYGQEYLSLAKMVGQGAVAVSDLQESC